MSVSPIIFENESSDVFIIDIPTSIAAAQRIGDALGPSDWRLTSCPAQLEPFKTSEPRTSAAAGRVSNHNRDADLHEAYAGLIAQALAVAKNEFPPGKYCYERALSSEGSIRGRKRQAAEAFSEDASPNDERAIRAAEMQLSVTLRRLSKQASTLASDIRIPLFAPVATNATHGSMPQNEQINASNQTPFFKNETEKTVIISTERESNKAAGFSFLVPSHSAFLLGRCEDVLSFRAAARIHAPETRGRFDFVLLDPPWPNRSALRKSSYNNPGDDKSIKNLLLRMDLDSHILPEGFVAVWITNKPEYRRMVLGSGGLFESWNVGLVEEWIWVKVTSPGEPVMAINGLWRKPYEVLLIGRAAQSSLAVAESAQKGKRRVLMGVADLHSRKPCLKQLIEQILLRRTSNYDALEIFARHLVAGWFSWGDEVLKYNWDEYWVPTEKAEQETLDAP